MQPFGGGGLDRGKRGREETQTSRGDRTRPWQEGDNGSLNQGRPSSPRREIQRLEPDPQTAAHFVGTFWPPRLPSELTQSKSPSEISPIGSPEMTARAATRVGAFWPHMAGELPLGSPRAAAIHEGVSWRTGADQELVGLVGSLSTMSMQDTSDKLLFKVHALSSESAKDIQEYANKEHGVTNSAVLNLKRQMRTHAITLVDFASRRELAETQIYSDQDAANAFSGIENLLRNFQRANPNLVPFSYVKDLIAKFDALDDAYYQAYNGR